jgi:predicted ATPase
LATIWSNHELSKRLSSIKDGPAYKELKSLSEEAGQLKLDCQAIIDAVIFARDEESRDIVETSKSKVREYFDLLANNPGIDAIEMTIETKRGNENYGFYDSAGDNVIPVLSQGDLNSLALVIFAGLGEANRGALAFQTIVFDDPSQSMGSHHKQKLAELINTLAKNRQVIVSTMDKEFFEALNAAITVRKKCVTFDGWDPENGPRISD